MAINFTAQRKLHPIRILSCLCSRMQNDYEWLQEPLCHLLTWTWKVCWPKPTSLAMIWKNEVDRATGRSTGMLWCNVMLCLHVSTEIFWRGWGYSPQNIEPQKWSPGKGDFFLETIIFRFHVGGVVLTIGFFVGRCCKRHRCWCHHLLVRQDGSAWGEWDLMQDHFSLNIFCLLGFRHSKQQSLGAEDLPTLQTMQRQRCGGCLESPWV